ncbi:hypothetical protein Pelo_10254 [Pelomyxa schiedti]|nr:hypothetical protein Pelo_10254 [Pelomyxa schiedti]
MMMMSGVTPQQYQVVYTNGGYPVTYPYPLVPVMQQQTVPMTPVAQQTTAAQPTVAQPSTKKKAASKPKPKPKPKAKTEHKKIDASLALKVREAKRIEEIITPAAQLSQEDKRIISKVREVVGQVVTDAEILNELDRHNRDVGATCIALSEGAGEWQLESKSKKKKERQERERQAKAAQAQQQQPASSKPVTPAKPVAPAPVPAKPTAPAPAPPTTSTSAPATTPATPVPAPVVTAPQPTAPAVTVPTPATPATAPVVAPTPTAAAPQAKGKTNPKKKTTATPQQPAVEATPPNTEEKPDELFSRMGNSINNELGVLANHEQVVRTLQEELTKAQSEGNDLLASLRNSQAELEQQKIRIESDLRHAIQSLDTTEKELQILHTTTVERLSLTHKRLDVLLAGSEL